MKKIRLSGAHLVTAMLTGTITLLGFSGCKTAKKTDVMNPVQEIPQMKVMYGTPSTMYRQIEVNAADSVADTPDAAPGDKTTPGTK